MSGVAGRRSGSGVEAVDGVHGHVDFLSLIHILLLICSPTSEEEQQQNDDACRDSREQEDRVTNNESPVPVSSGMLVFSESLPAAPTISPHAGIGGPAAALLRLAGRRRRRPEQPRRAYLSHRSANALPLLPAPALSPGCPGVADASAVAFPTRPRRHGHPA